MKTIACVLFILLAGSAAFAQGPPTSYEFRTYVISGPAVAPQPWQFAAMGVVCNQAPPTANASTVNPTMLVWDDPAVTGRVCRYTFQPTDPLLSFPLGTYEGAVVPFNAAGPGPESNRAPFQRETPPGAPTGFRVIR